MNVVEQLRERFLVQRFLAGDEQAFAKLIESYERRLLYYLKRFERDGDRALDVLQEVWLTAWKTRGSLRSSEAFRSWIYRIAHGKVVSVIREESRRTQREQLRQTSLPTSEPHVGEVLAAAEVVHFALSRLTAEHREVLTLRFLESMSLDEIADVTNLPVGTVKSRLHYAHQEMLALVKEQENGSDE